MESGTQHVYTPSDLNRELKLHLEAGFPRVLVEAEVSNLARPASGHLYFSLKDDRSQLRCAMFRSAAARSGVRPENGMKVLARGRISLYEPRGDCQFIVDGLQEAGEGLLQRQFEELKRKLEAEGLFDTALKKPLPAYPERIGLVTSPSGAAVRDMIHVLGRRWPVAKLRLYPVRVQGSEAPGEIRAALRAANRHGWAEVLLLGRGGGSLEDLAGFNDEGVAREVAASAIPVISAVGHETDFSICDFIADLRAPTPSAAAELATPEQAALTERFRRAERQLGRRIGDRVQRESQRLDHLGHRLRQKHPAARLEEQSRQLAALSTRLGTLARHTLEQRKAALHSATRQLATHRPDRMLDHLREQVTQLAQRVSRLGYRAVRSRRDQLGTLARTLQAVSPLETIGRGYAIVTAAESGKVISDVGQTGTGERICARLRDGELDCTVDAVRPRDENG